MEKFDELKYWLDTNQHIRQALIFAGLTFAVLGSMNYISSEIGKNLGPWVAFLLIMLMIFQFILGIKQVGKDIKEREKYKAKYKKWWDKQNKKP